MNVSAVNIDEFTHILHYNQKRMNCPLCQSLNCPIYDKSYFRCAQCELIFLNPRDHLPPDEERKRYEMHNNDPTDAGYQESVRDLFLNVQKYDPQGLGLDYGSGPSAQSAIQKLLVDRNYQIHQYDPIFYPKIENSILYDWIILCETAEHFYSPSQNFIKIKAHLKAHGYLFIQTQLVTPKTDFSKWHYRRDPTHVSFYSLKTIEKICQLFNFKLIESDAKQIIVLQSLG